MNFYALSYLINAPSKKYIRKLFEYSYLMRGKLLSFQELMETPVSTQMSQDLQLNEKTTHQLIFAMAEFISICENLQWDAEEMRKIFPQDFDAQLAQIIVDTMTQISQLADKITNREICQAHTLIDLDWRLDVQIRTHNQQKVNQPILFLQMETLDAESNEKNHVILQMNVNEVKNLHQNLKKIKEQISGLVID